MAQPLFELDHALDQNEVKSYADQLNNLQGNILKSHGRGAAAHVFLTFRQGKQAAVKKFLRELSEHLTSAVKQRAHAEYFRGTGNPENCFISLCLSASGYTYLDFETGVFPSDEFRKGMRSRRNDLGDPSPEEWEPQFQRDLHAMLILADDRVEVITRLLSRLRKQLKDFAEVGVEFGLTMRNADENAIEHFGYADGLSQPLFFESDLKGTKDRWNPFAGPKLVLVPDPYGGSSNACGTYFVFRKLEQNVRAFKAHEQSLADERGLTGDERERVGAKIIGRFENGTPIELHTDALPSIPGKDFIPENDFNYQRDFKGESCPYTAHIRVMNARIVNQDTDDAKDRRIARRGITYGDPTPPGDNLYALPTGGVGLLFQCCQANLGEQFEWLQMVANGAREIDADPIIGQSQWHPNQFVRMKGGEYFFVPSISFFRNLKQ